MSILPQPIKDTLARLLSFLGQPFLPGSCLLCGANSQHDLLCTDCSADLPLLPAAHCPQCCELSPHGERCGACLKEAPHFDLSLAHFCYEFPVDRIIHALKYGHQLPIAGWLGSALATHAALAECDCIMPLPLHPQRLQDRGFNQSGEIARVISRQLQRPLILDSLLRTRATPPQATLPLKERHANVRGAFECRSDLSGQSILLIDDVMTTGATLNECARVLKLHGARQVTVAVAARALRQD